jgi:sigma-E factor negative regulatory protein RseC
MPRNKTIKAMKNVIEHKAKVIEMTPEFTSVEIQVSSACSECHAKGLCGISEEEQKVISLPTDPYATYNVGDEVELCTKRTMGMKAVWISYVIPLMVLMILILSLSKVFAAYEQSEVIAGLGALAGVAVYYFVIWLLRGRLNNEFVFYIK